MAGAEGDVSRGAARSGSEGGGGDGGGREWRQMGWLRTTERRAGVKKFCAGLGEGGREREDRDSDRNSDSDRELNQTLVKLFSPHD